MSGSYAYPNVFAFNLNNLLDSQIHPIVFAFSLNNPLDGEIHSW